MKNGKFTIKNKKVRYGSLSITLTAVIIAAVVIFNVIFTSLARKRLWYIDMTPDQIYTLSETGKNYFESTIKSANEDRTEKGEEDVKIEIIFCDEPDALNSNETQKLVYHMAQELENQFPDTIEVKWVDIIKNPSAVQKYGKPKTTSVIVTSGTEYRTLSLRNFFVFDEDSEDTPWGHKMERTYAVAIAAVTRAESPIACLTTNHGEAFYDTEMANLLVDAGYEVVLLDLATGEIPEDCRLIVTYNPQSDFLVADGVSTISEVDKLDKFLDGAHSFMIFTDADTPELPNLEEYLEEWGITYSRAVDEISTDGNAVKYPYMIKDTTRSLSTDGFTFIGEYETKGFGGSVTNSMRNNGTPKKVIFKNATAIEPSKYYELSHYHNEEESGDTTNDFYFYQYYQNGVSRSMYNVFTTSAQAQALANGKTVAEADELNKFSLMTITKEIRTIQDDNYFTQSNDSYVIACSSTEFVSQALLQSAVYGNSDLMLSTLRTVGSETVPVGLSLTPFADSTISSITTAQATQYTVALTVIPAVIMFGLGVFVIVRRKYS